MAQLEPEALEKNFSACDLATLAREAIIARATVAGERRIDLGLARSAPVSVRGDAATLSMLLANLLDNALRYTPEGGRIDVAIDSDSSGPVLSVTDTGPGIAPSERSRVFDRFYRGGSETSASGGQSGGRNGAQVGSGLGQSIVKRIADAHGATILLDDGTENRGLAVRVQFPGSS